MKIPPEIESLALSPEGAQLCKVAASDFSALADFSRALWRAAYEPQILSPDVSDRLWARSYSIPALETADAGGEKLFWITIQGDRIGFVAYRLETLAVKMRLSKLYLRPDCWGRRIGAWVLQWVTEVALHAGAQCIDLYVFRQNTRAVQAYLRAGFIIKREEFTDLGNGLIYDDFVMVKEVESQGPL